MQRSMKILYSAMTAGAAELARHQALLDRINVFPVMDGDTGTNMRCTLDGFFADEGADSDTLYAAIPRLLCAACGNSGIILAQFIAGFIESIEAAPEFTLADFSKAAMSGKDRAYRSVMHPKEGTMLSAISDFASILSAHKDPFDLPAHAALCDEMLQGVIATQEMLPKLKAAGVVDAGALGFFLFSSGLALAAAVIADAEGALQKIADTVSGAAGVSIEKIRDAAAPSFIEEARAFTAEKQFCVNLLIETDSPQDPRVMVDGLGDSTNVAKDGRLIKLHIHVDDADALVARIATFGKIIDSKIQDMRAALMVTLPLPNAPEDISYQRFRVVTDSGVSLDRAIASHHGILRIDTHVHLYGKRVQDSDINLDELLLGMRSGHLFKTAQVTQEEAMLFLARALNYSDHVLYIGVGNAYTGTQESIRAAGQKLQTDRLTILDSRAASGQLGLICLAVQRFANTAERLEEVIAYATAQIASCTEYLVIDDFKFLVQSGRIGRIRAAFASALNVKPIVGHGGDGAITIAKVRSTNAAVDEILRRTALHPGTGSFLVMVEHTDNIDFTKTICARLGEVLPADAEILLSPLSSASAVHMGPGTFGVAVTRV